MGRAPCCDKANVKKGPWSPEEDAKLKDYIEENGTGGNWIALPQKIGLRRCGKSCRLRWLNYLRPNLRHGGFSEEEDQIICSLYISIGSRWSIIAAQLPGRTDNDIKNYWNTKLKKKLLGSRREPPQSCREPKDEADGANREPPRALSASALERMQLHMQLQGLHSPFSFYNHPALWPKFHPLGDIIIQSNGRQAPDAASIEPSREQVLQFNPEIPNSMNANMQEGFENPTVYLSPNSAAAANGPGTPNSNFGLVAAGLQAELQDLIYDQSHEFIDLDCAKEINGEKESMSWWASNSFDEKSSPSSWDLDSALEPDTMLQGYVMRYDL